MTVSLQPNGDLHVSLGRGKNLPRPVTPEQCALIRELLGADMTDAEISHETGIDNVQVVEQVRCHMGFRRRGHNGNGSQNSTPKRKVSNREIAEAYNGERYDAPGRMIAR